MRMRVVVAVICLLVVSVGAQVARGRVAGVITDPAGAVLPGVTVTLAGSEQRRVVTNERGEFTFENLVPGRYTLRATLPGFVDLVREVSVAGRGTVRLTLQMGAGARSETVTVLPESPGSSRPSALPPPAVAGGVVGSVEGHFLARAYDRVADFNTETYDYIDEGGIRRVADNPLSTFSIDVDTASYANVRRFLTDGSLPPAGAVRIEELINYFRFDYPQPAGGDPFSVTTELAACPWNPSRRLALIGIRGRESDDREPAPRNLVFLLDVSGSMQPHDKLPLVRNAMRMLVDTLTSQDRIAIVVYAGASGLVLPSTRGDQKEDDPPRARAARGWRIDERRGRHQARLPDRPPPVRARRRQSRHPRDRRRFQRRRHQPGRADSSHRA